MCANSHTSAWRAARRKSTKLDFCPERKSDFFDLRRWLIRMAWPRAWLKPQLSYIIFCLMPVTPWTFIRRKHIDSDNLLRNRLMMLTNFDDVVLDEHDAVELLSLGHVERCAATFLSAPTAADEWVTHDHVVLTVTRVHVQCRVAPAVFPPRTQIHRKPSQKPAHRRPLTDLSVQAYI